jgi:hypothetical protein
LVLKLLSKCSKEYTKDMIKFVLVDHLKNDSWFMQDVRKLSSSK